MGNSADGLISYGIILPEDIELPWEEVGLDEWWRDTVNGYTPSVELYSDTDPSGYVNGIEPTARQFDQYFAEQRAFMEAHPCPVEVGTYGSGYDSDAGRILEISGKGVGCDWSKPTAFDPAALIATEADATLLLEFCKTHGIDVGDAKPAWYLSSYWG